MSETADMKKSERCTMIGYWLARGDVLTVERLAERLEAPRRYVLRDLEIVERILPVVWEESGLIRLLVYDDSELI
jgi:predicted DNA-binding transcriptional regulator YafY